jgi:mono/diheme cytochrome c family protein
MTVATSIQQAVAFVIAAIVAVGALLWLLANVRRAKPEVGAELELAPNRKAYYDDEGMEGVRLDRFLFWGLISMTIIAVGLPLYWLAEPGRQAGAIKFFREYRGGESEIHHQPVGGGALFAPTSEGGFNCAGCHGPKGIGGSAPYTFKDPATGNLRQVAWKAPTLNDVTLRMTDEQLTEVLTYGRPFSPMPAWGLAGGGPLNEQQIQNLIYYLHDIQITPEEAKKKAAEDADAELARMKGLQAALDDAKKALAAATTIADKQSAQNAVSGLEADIANAQEQSIGAALFNTNCARCHTLGWSYGEPHAPGGGAFGPPLSNVLNQFPLRDDHIKFVGEGTKVGEKYGRQGKSSGRMPHFNTTLTRKQICEIVNYERRLAGESAAEQKVCK